MRLVAGAALVARLQLGMMPLALILLTRSAGHSYGEAGAVVAAYMVATAVTAPYVARLADLHGQRRVLLVCAGAFPAALALVCLLLAMGAPLWLVLPVSASAGAAVPPVSACVRVLWTRLVPPDLRYPAFAVEAVLQEIVFMSGPLLVVLAVHAGSPTAAIAAAALTASAGAAVFASTRASRAERGRRVDGTPRAVARPGLRVVLLFDAVLGVVWGSIEVVMPAFADQAGSASHGGPALTALAIGSLCGGLVSGALGGSDARRRLLISGLLVSITLAPTLLAGSHTTMVGVMLIVGLPMAPAWASVYALVGQLAPGGRDNESYAWLTTATTGGVAIGLFATGATIDRFGVRGGLCALLGAGLVCGGSACLAYRALASPELEGRRHSGI